MYPKSTFSERFTQSTNRQSSDLRESHLVFHSREQEEFQRFDILVPWLIVYESIHLHTGATVYQEFSKDRQIFLSTPYSEYRKINRKLHNHDFYEITYVLSGQVTMQIEDETVCYEAGECCVCNKNIHHVEVMDEDTELVLLMLKEEFLQDLLCESVPSDRQRTASGRDSLFTRFFAENRRNPLYDAKVYADFRRPDRELRETLLGIVNSLIEEITAEHLGKRYMLRALLCRFLELMETSPAWEQQVHSAKLSREEQVVYKLARAYRKRSTVLTREEVERLTGYCGDHVERIVKRHTGMTLSEYGRLYLLQKAAQLLRDSGLSVGEICEQLGYSNRTYFNRIFLQRYGVTPGEYRRQSRAK